MGARTAVSGYSRLTSAYLRELPEVGRGTPVGELMRRYWLVVALSRDPTGTPRKIRLLGEDLVLFRDRTGASQTGPRALLASVNHAWIVHSGEDMRETPRPLESGTISSVHNVARAE